jgi:hypothetical protein
LPSMASGMKDVTSAASNVMALGSGVPK